MFCFYPSLSLTIHICICVLVYKNEKKHYLCITTQELLSSVTVQTDNLSNDLNEAQGIHTRNVCHLQAVLGILEQNLRKF